MLRHVVLYRIKDEFKAEIPPLIENFCSMKGKIDLIVDSFLCFFIYRLLLANFFTF